MLFGFEPHKDNCHWSLEGSIKPGISEISGSRQRVRGYAKDEHLNESFKRRISIHDYNTREWYTVATRLAFKRLILVL